MCLAHLPIPKCRCVRCEPKKRTKTHRYFENCATRHVFVLNVLHTRRCVRSRTNNFNWACSAVRAKARFAQTKDHCVIFLFIRSHVAYIPADIANVAFCVRFYFGGHIKMEPDWRQTTLCNLLAIPFHQR